MFTLHGLCSVKCTMKYSWEGTAIQFEVVVVVSPRYEDKENSKSGVIPNPETAKQTHG